MKTIKDYSFLINLVYIFILNIIFIPLAHSLDCPANITRGVDLDACGARVNFAVPPDDFYYFARITFNNDNQPNDHQLEDITYTFPNIPEVFVIDFPLGTTALTVTYLGINDVQSSCSFQVTIIDDQAPIFDACPSPITVSNDEGDCGAMVNWPVPTLVDNCTLSNEATVNISSGSFFEEGTTTVTYQGMDDVNQMAMCTFTVTVNDAEAPKEDQIPAHQNLANQLGDCGRNVAWTVPQFTDNCEVASVVFSHEPNDFFELGTTTVTYTATDIHDNVHSIDFDITIHDTERPQESAIPANQSLVNELGDCGRNVSWVVPQFTDNCGVASVVSSHEPNDFFEVGTTTVTYTATDIHDNVHSIDFDITISDTERPQESAIPADQSLVNQLGDCGRNVSWVVPQFTDNCGVALVVSSHEPNDFFEVGTTSVTYNVTDIHGNNNIISFDITVEDNEAPAFIEPMMNVEVASEAGQCGANVSFGLPAVTDNCGIATYTSSFTSGEFFGIGTTIVVLNIVDIHGNMTENNFHVIVNDNETPSFVSCPELPSSLLSTEQCGATYNFSGLGVVAVDNCNFTISNDAPELFPIGITPLTWTATDMAGNTATCMQQVSISGHDGIILECMDNLSFSIDEGNDLSAIDWNVPAALSTCATCQSTDLEGFQYLGAFEGHQYFVSEQASNWPQAQQISQGMQAHLAVINHKKENEYLSALLPYDKVLFGLSDRKSEGTFEWMNGDIYAYNAFIEDLDNSNQLDYGVLNKTGAWTLTNAGQPYHFILEKPCVDIQALHEHTGIETGTHELAYTYTSICGEEAICYVELNINNSSQNAYCQNKALGVHPCSEEDDLWITELAIAGQSYFSEDEAGYADFSNFSFVLSAGQEASLKINSNENTASHQRFVMIWVDWNKDGDFYDADEQLLQRNIENIQNIELPSNILSGDYRMRVILSDRKNVAPCGSFEFGETEDYTLNVESSFGLTANSNVNFQVQKSQGLNLTEGLNVASQKMILSPNPVTDCLFVQIENWEAQKAQVQIFDVHGKLLFEKSMSLKNGLISIDLQAENINHLGIYLLKVSAGNGETLLSKFVLK